MLISVISCTTGSTGDFCMIYGNPIYTTQFERDMLRDSTLLNIDEKNAIWACQCSKEIEFCE